MHFHEGFYGFCTQSIIGKCTSRHLFAYGGFQLSDLTNKLTVTVVPMIYMYCTK